MVSGHFSSVSLSCSDTSSIAGAADLEVQAITVRWPPTTSPDPTLATSTQASTPVSTPAEALALGFDAAMATARGSAGMGNFKEKNKRKEALDSN